MATNKTPVKENDKKPAEPDTAANGELPDEASRISVTEDYTNELVEMSCAS